MWAVYTNDADGKRIRVSENGSETKLGAACDMEWIAKYIYDDSAENAGLYVERIGKWPTFTWIKDVRLSWERARSVATGATRWASGILRP